MTRTGVVGAGRVGAVLAAAWRAAGHEIVAVAGASPASRSRAETLLPGVPLAEPGAVARACDLLVLAVPDDTLGDVVTRLSADGAIRAGQQVAHTSGRHGLAVLAPAVDRGAEVLAVHPAMTFTGTELDLSRLGGCVFGVTATPSTHAVADALVTDLGGRPMWVPEDLRTRYHAGLAHGANHLVTLVAQALDLLAASGADDPAAALRPLLTSALDDALRDGHAALTGPVVRGDVRTVRAHLGEIGTSAPETLDSYVVMARATAHRAVRDGRLRPDRGAELLAALDDAVARVGADA